MLFWGNYSERCWVQKKKKKNKKRSHKLKTVSEEHESEWRSASRSLDIRRKTELFRRQAFNHFSDCYSAMCSWFIILQNGKKRHTITTITSQPNSLFSICQFISNVQNDPVTNCVSQVWALSNVLRLHWEYLVYIILQKVSKGRA